MAFRLLVGGTLSSPTIEFSREIQQLSGELITALDAAGTELAADTLDIVLDYRYGGFAIFAPADLEYDGILSTDGFLLAGAEVDGLITEYPYGTPVWLMDGSTVLAKLYVAESRQIGRWQYRLTAQSAIGMLERLPWRGAIFTDETVADALDLLIGNAFAYTVTPQVGAQTVRGPLPPGNCRDALHLLCFAMGISLTKDAAGDMVFTFLDPDAVPAEIPAERLFWGGSQDFPTPATAVEVQEHSVYALPAQTDAEQLFDNTGQTAAAGLLVQFDAPFYDLTASTGLTIDESGPYYAILTGNGTMSGKPYIHNTRTVRKDAASPAGDENVIPSGEDTLINALNSESVARRLLAYYEGRRMITRTIRQAREKAGQLVALSDSFGTPAQGWIVEARARLGAQMVKSELKILAGYTPTGQGNFYSSVVRITASGSWTVPAGVTRIRIVLIGGGSGGAGGYAGEAGRGGEKDYDGWQTYQELTNSQNVVYQKTWGYAGSDGEQAGAGGDPGAGGLGGKIISLDLDVEPGKVFTVALGSGGSAGAAGTSSTEAGAGTAGTDSTITSDYGTLSTADGQRVASGYFDPLGGSVYGAAGAQGVPGSAGGTTTTIAPNGFSGESDTETAGVPGASAGSSAGGVGGRGYYLAMTASGQLLTIRGGGGGGGGAAAGASGSAGQAATLNTSNPSQHVLQGGQGGGGANAAVPATANYGCGGGGGNGGGGGGNGGGCRVIWYAGTGGYSLLPALGGTGGTGSAGSAGGSGIGLIYY